MTEKLTTGFFIILMGGGFGLLMIELAAGCGSTGECIFLPVWGG